ncbi:DUF2939 domain-containing protein [Desulfoferula mesophila]|uniref:DUF2939 domain-containing protein n=1 Tax=Desulfoferula mesophila TaxID=3058419 RepID=A0AAU9F2Z0_9BACT|nr:hypothetical protein FAK_19730 [Desulfoferula mesophilus]
MRRWWLWILLAFLATGAFYLTHSFLDGPRWALYQIGKAIHDREPHLFLAHVDIENILQGQKETIVDLVAPKGQKDDDTRNLVRGLVGAFMAPLSDQMAAQVVKAINDPNRKNLPSSWTLVFASSVTRNGNYALVVFSEPEKGRRLRLGMEKVQNGPWRVVDIDPNDLKRLAKDFLDGRHGVKLGPQAMPQTGQTQPEQPQSEGVPQAQDTQSESASALPDTAPPVQDDTQSQPPAAQ